MAAELRSVSIVAPGFAGLNTQDSSVAITKDFALKAENAVIDQFGRIACRGGWDNVNTSAGYNSTEPTLLHEVVKQDGTTQIVSIGNNRIYTGTTTLTQVYDGSATWTAQNWKAVNFNDHTYFFQRAHNPLIYDHAGNTWTLVSAHPSYSGTVQLANEVLAAYGRLWVADTSTNKTTIWWSDTLIGYKWNGGTSGSLDIENVFTNGTDSIVGLAAFNGFLIIFCKKSLIIYSGAASDPASNLTLVEVIDGVGCIARDSIQDVGTDIFFLSDTGVRSLGRTIQEKSAPLFDVSKNVRDDLISDIAINEDNENIKSVFYEKSGFYLLSLPTRELSYCLDLKQRLQDGSCKVTTWTLAPKALLSTRDRKLYISRAGYIGEYAASYSDNGTTIRFLYYTSHLDAGNASILKILKKLSMLVIGGSQTQVFLKWGTDYTSNYQSAELAVIPSTTQSEYNVSEFNIAEYFSTTKAINILKAQLSNDGRVFQVGIEANVSADVLSIQQMDVFFKTGRTV
jgi:hypothetical protein